jgi:hypothetical protein
MFIGFILPTRRGNAMKKEPETARSPTPYEKFVALARKVVQTPKAEVDKRERAWREERKRKRRA